MALWSGLLRDRNFRAHLDQPGWAADRLMLLVGAIGVGCEMVASIIHTPAGKFWAYLALLLSTGLFLWAKEGLAGRGGEVIWRMFQIGLIAGLLEILVDWALIDWITHGRLFYKSTPVWGGTKDISDVVLLGSPIWMPMAWACLITVLGYFALRLYKLWLPKFGETKTMLLVSFLIAIQAGISVGLNEWLAADANWWMYGPACQMFPPASWNVTRCPTCIPLGEAFQFFLLLPVAAKAFSRDKTKPIEGALLGGSLFAVVIALGYSLAYLLLEFGRPLPPA
ncbi:hypothetical protein BH10PLA2_BH10PLA2_29520 [soil metagenome]